MNNTIIYAVNMLDARAACKKLGLNFSQTTWVLGPEYLGEDYDFTGKTIYKTDAWIAAHPGE